MSKVLFLALSAYSGSEFLKVFAAIRHALIGTISAYTSLAMGVGCLLLVFHLIVIGYKGMSDEQQGGFGGIQMKELLRPMILVFMIQASPTIVSALDSALDNITYSIMKQTDAATCDARFGAVLAAQNIRREAAKDGGDVSKAFYEYGAAADTTKVYEPTVYGFQGSVSGGFYKNPNDEDKANYVMKSSANIPTKAEVERLAKLHPEKAREYRGLYDEMVSGITGALACQARLADIKQNNNAITGAGAFAAVTTWMYTVAYKVLIVFAEMFLCIIAVFFPWTLAISIIEKWRNAWVFWANKYVQVSFWKVTGSLINYIVYFGLTQMEQFNFYTNMAKADKAAATLKTIGMAAVDTTAVTTPEIMVTAEDMKEVGNLIKWGDVFNSFSERAVICLAGLLAMLKVASITEALIPQMEGNTQSGGSGDMGASGAMLVSQMGHTGSNTATAVMGAGKDAAGGAVAGAASGEGLGKGVMKGLAQGAGKTLADTM